MGLTLKGSFAPDSLTSILTGEFLEVADSPRITARAVLVTCVPSVPDFFCAEFSFSFFALELSFSDFLQLTDRKSVFMTMAAFAGVLGAALMISVSPVSLSSLRRLPEFSSSLLLLFRHLTKKCEKDRVIHVEKSTLSPVALLSYLSSRRLSSLCSSCQQTWVSS